MALDRSSLLAEMRLKTEVVKMEAGDVIMSELSGPDYMKLYTDPLNKKTVDGVEVMEMGRFQAALIVYGAVDDAGNRIFKDEDIDVVGRGSQTTFFRLAEAARKLNGMSGEELKNSNETESENSSSDSVSMLVADTPTN